MILARKVQEGPNPNSARAISLAAADAESAFPGRCESGALTLDGTVMASLISCHAQQAEAGPVPSSDGACLSQLQPQPNATGGRVRYLNHVATVGSRVGVSVCGLRRLGRDRSPDLPRTASLWGHRFAVRVFDRSFRASRACATHI